MWNFNSEKYEQIIEELKRLNEKRRKKRVSNKKLQTTQLLAHTIPLSCQRFLLAPMYRAATLAQLNLYSQSPINILKGNVNVLKSELDKYSDCDKVDITSAPLTALYGSTGYRDLWRGYIPNIVSGVVFPTVYLCGKSVMNFKYTHERENNSIHLLKRYTETLSVCSIAHLFNYPFDTAYNRIIASDHNIQLKQYLKDTSQKYGIRRLYSGLSLCLLSTSVHLTITIPLNYLLHHKLIDSLNDQLLEHPILMKKVLMAKDLKPVELYPWNIISSTFTIFIAKTITYPLDTLSGFDISVLGCITSSL